MKLLVLALFIGLVSANGITEDKEEPVEVIVNGLAEGEPLEIGDILGVKVKEHIDGQVIANDPLFPFTAEGLAAAAPEQTPEEIVIPSPVLPEIPAVVPQPEAPIVVLPEGIAPEGIRPPGPVVVAPFPAEPETPENIAPEGIRPPGPSIVAPFPVQPETPENIAPGPVIIHPEVQPEVAQQLPEVVDIPNSEIFNDGVVHVQVNVEDPGMISTLQSWFSMVVNYFSGDEQITQHVV